MVYLIFEMCYMGATSSMTAHPKAVNLPPLHGSDVLIMTLLSEAPGHEPSAMVAAITDAVGTPSPLLNCFLNFLS